MENQPETMDTRTRANLAYIWSASAIAMLGYILYMWGARTEILTLIIGLIGGTVLGGIFGVYFAGVTSAKKSEPTTTVNTDKPAGDVIVNP